MRHIRRFSGTGNERGFLKFSFLTEKPRIMWVNSLYYLKSLYVIVWLA
jgi:hypothetical protein